MKYFNDIKSILVSISKNQVTYQSLIFLTIIIYTCNEDSHDSCKIEGNFARNKSLIEVNQNTNF